jgi:hypothetical protein
MQMDMKVPPVSMLPGAGSRHKRVHRAAALQAPRCSAWLRLHLEIVMPRLQRLSMIAGLVLACVIAAGVAAPSPAEAAAKKGMRLWNLTGETLDRVELAPAGTGHFGRDQCRNDKDGEVDFDEELPITDVTPGSYDIRVRDVHGRTCLAKAVVVKAEGAFTVHEKDLVDCKP